MKSLALRIAALTVLALLLTGGRADACAVCFGDTDSTMGQGMNNGILALLAVVAVVQGGFVALFLSIRRRSQKLREKRESFRLIEGGVR